MKLALAVLAAVLTLFSVRADAKLIFQTQKEGIVLMIYDEPCAFTDTVAMPFKATWTQEGKTLEGCWLPRPDVKVLLFYFPSDKSVFPVHMSLFQRLTDA